MGKVKKSMRMGIRSSILNEYKLGNNPHETSQKVQKMFGLNFETRFSTIRLWFEQFYLGDESLKNDPFREDLIPKSHKTRRRIDVPPPPAAIISSKTTSSSPNSNDTQKTRLLLFELKDQVDRLYRKINAQNNCLQLVDRFLKKLNPNNRIPTGVRQTPIEIFYSNYHFLREKCQRLPIKANNINFYDILYDNLYCDEEMRKNRIVRRRSIQKIKSITTNNNQKKKKKSLSNRCQTPKLQKRKKIGRPKSLPTQTTPAIPVKCEQCDKILKNQLRLRIHVQQIHERTDRKYCTFEGCTVNYAYQLTLNRHIRKVHTKDAREYRCTWVGCSYLTYTGDMLRKHSYVHTGERPYKCVWPGCEKAFKSNSTLAFHKSIHENKRQYKCHWPECGYACNLSSNLKKHTTNHERKQNLMIQSNRDVT